MISQPSQMKMFASSEGLTLSPEDFHAKLSQWLANEEALTIQEALSFLKLLVSQGYSDPVIYCSKTSKAYSITPGGETFHTILNTLAELGYWWEYQVLNSKDFGVPQNRERVFIIGHLGGKPRREVFPITGTSGQALRRLIGGRQGYSVYDPSGTSVTLTSQTGGLGGKTGLYAIPVLTPDRLEKRQNGRRFKEPGEPMFTLTSQDRHGVLVRHTKDGFHLARNDEKKSSIQGTHVTYPEGKSHCLGTSHVPMTIEKPPHIPGPEDINNTVRSGGRGSLTAKHNHDTIHDGCRIRRLTPLECFRLQGFPDEHFHNAKAVGVSDSQLYKQAGNAVTVNVVYEIAKRLGG